MAADRFERALALVLTFEGGFVNHPKDPGGATNLGITRATLSRARGRPASVADVKALTRLEASGIYRRSYWDTVAGDRLPAGLDLAVFDIAVNSGPGRAARLLQRALHIAEDGVIGPQTLASAAAGDAAATIKTLCAERLAFLRGLSHWAPFGRGWSRRVSEVERAALADAARLPTSIASSHPSKELS